MTTFNTVDELLEILDNDPRLLEAVRIKILTEDLIRLPHEFEEFKKETNKRFDGIDARLDGHDERFDGIDARFDGVDARFDGVDARFDGVDARFDGIDERLDGMDAAINSLRGDVGDLKGHFAGRAAREDAAFIAAEMGLEWNRTLERVDVLRIWQSADRNGLTEGISQGDRRSFLRSDIIMDALDSHGTQCFVAVEISYVVHSTDTSRAVRNAEYLTRFTGVPTYMAVAGVSKNPEIDDVISEDSPLAFDVTQDSKIFWLELEDLGSPD